MAIALEFAAVLIDNMEHLNIQIGPTRVHALPLGIAVERIFHYLFIFFFIILFILRHILFSKKGNLVTVMKA